MAAAARRNEYLCMFDFCGTHKCDLKPINVSAPHHATVTEPVPHQVNLNSELNVDLKASRGKFPHTSDRFLQMQIFEDIYLMSYISVEQNELNS